MLTWPLVPVVHWTPWDTACDLNFYSGDMHRPGRCLAQKAVSLIRETNSIGQNGRVVIKDHYCETSLSCPSWILHPPPNKTKQKTTKNNNKTKQKQENKKKTKKKQTNKNKQNNNNKKHKTITITKQKQKLNKNKTTKTTRTSPKTNNNSNQDRLIRNRKKCTGKETLNYR